MDYWTEQVIVIFNKPKRVFEGLGETEWLLQGPRFVLDQMHSACAGHEVIALQTEFHAN